MLEIQEDEEEKDQYYSTEGERAASKYILFFQICLDDLGRETVLQISETQDPTGMKRTLADMPRKERENIVLFLEKYPDVRPGQLNRYLLREFEFAPWL